MPKTYNHVKVDFFNSRADTAFTCSTNLVRIVKKLSPNFK